MQTEQKSLLVETFSGVLEDLAFMFGDVVDTEELVPTANEYVRASMQFGGEMKGTLSIVVPSDMCREIAANILGMSEDDEFVVARSEDSMKEVLNVTCGHILTEMAGDKPVFNLSPPVIARIDAEEWTALLNDPITVSCLVDEEPVLLQLHIEDARA